MGHEPQPTSRSSSSYGSGSTSQRLVAAAGLLLLIVLVCVATALSSGTRITLAGLPRFLGRQHMPGTAFCGPSALVHHAEELEDILDVACGELLHHLPIPHTLAKCNNNRSIENARDGIVNLGEPLDEATQ
jgi:hypothetical protein